MIEMGIKFSRMVIFSNHYKILESKNAIRGPWCLP